MIRSLWRAGNARVTSAVTLTPPTYVAAGTGSDTFGGSSIAPAYPGGIAAGDLFVVAGVGYLTSVDQPSGWTLIYGPDTSAGTQNNYIYARDARASGSESGTVTFTLTGNRANGRMYAFRGCAGTGPTDPFEAHATASGTGAITNPSVTRGAAGRLVCAAWMGFTTTPSVTPGGSPTGGTWTEQAEYDGVNDIFVQELQTAGDVDISGGTTAFGGANQGFGHAFALIGV